MKYDIYVNQAGYPAYADKKAMISFAADRFNIVNSDMEILYSGNFSHFGPDEASRDDVYVADFSDFCREGSFKLVIPGLRGVESATFTIGSGVDEAVLDKMCKAFYYLRCGMELEPKYAGKFVHKACHCSPAKIWKKPEEPEVLAVGGWHDAGDYGRYVTPGAVAAAQLLYAYKMFSSAFDNQNLNIPESKEKLPDILAEAKYELEWLMKMQRADGGVYHKLTTQFHAAICMPEDDVKQLYMLPVSSNATADMSAVCAMASAVYREWDPVFADRLEAAAIKGGKWLLDNPEPVLFESPQDCRTGSYVEHMDDDNRFWAACELYFLTGENVWHEKVIEFLEKERFTKTSLGYYDVSGLGVLSYIINGCRERDEALIIKCKEMFMADAEKFARIADECGYGAAMLPTFYHWGSNMGLMLKACTFAIADYISGTHKYEAYARGQYDVLLGANALGFSYVSGVGGDSMQHPHLRPAMADGIDECIPGMVSGGPNADRSDPTAKLLVPEGMAPMKSYADDDRCYSLNEITIYWNSPAVFALAYLIDSGKGK